MAYPTIDNLIEQAKPANIRRKAGKLLTDEEIRQALSNLDMANTFCMMQSHPKERAIFNCAKAFAVLARERGIRMECLDKY